MINTPCNIFFVGTGNMGNPMARNLIAAGHAVSVFDLDKSKADNLLPLGATWCSSLSEGAQAAQLIITSLPGPPQVKEVILGTSGILANMKAKATLIDTTTSSVDLAQEIAKVAQERGLSYLEAPITNAIDAAMSGELAIFVGGNEACFNDWHPIFKVLGTDILFVGAPGNGAITKLITNLLWFVSAAAIGEGLMLGAKAGIPLEVVAKAITSSAGNSWVAEHDIPSIFAGHYDPSFSLALCCKDLGLILDIAKAQGVDLKMAKRAGELFLEAKAKYGPDAAELHVVRLLEDEVGFYLRPPYGTTDASCDSC